MILSFFLCSFDSFSHGKLSYLWVDFLSEISIIPIHKSQLDKHLLKITPFWPNQSHVLYPMIFSHDEKSIFFQYFSLYLCEWVNFVLPNQIPIFIILPNIENSCSNIQSKLVTWWVCVTKLTLYDSIIMIVRGSLVDSSSFFLLNSIVKHSLVEIF